MLWSQRLLIAIMTFTVFAAKSLAAPPIDYQRNVQPIFAEHCVQCHGIDQKHRKAKLRLDIRGDALKGGSSGQPAIVPGKPDTSELFLRISSKDAEEVMPPPSHNKPLTSAQVQLIKQWIAEGAKYENHWAFVAPKKVPLPSISKSPIDAFVQARLMQEKLAPSVPATPGVLCRRLYLDLIGLPPSPEELAAFERDGLEATMERLLQSERFGEKWARHWLDLARYSDTNGYEKDHAARNVGLA